MLINDPYGNYVIQTMIDIMVNPQVNYQNNNIDKLSLVLPDRQDNGVFQLQQKLQIAIIEYWFQNCKIVSSFGKRIQSKINTILNNNVPTSISMNKMHRKSQMNANGEFIVNEFPQPKRQILQPLPLSYRSTSSPAGVGIVMGGINNANEYYPKVNLQNRNFRYQQTFIMLMPMLTTTTITILVMAIMSIILLIPMLLLIITLMSTIKII